MRRLIPAIEGLRNVESFKHTTGDCRFRLRGKFIELELLRKAADCGLASHTNRTKSGKSLVVHPVDKPREMPSIVFEEQSSMEWINPMVAVRGRAEKDQHQPLEPEIRSKLFKFLKSLER